MGKGDKKSKRGKIIIGSYGVRRPSRKKHVAVPSVKTVEEKPKKAPKVTEEPVEVPVVAVEQPKTVEKKPRKAPVKKVAEGEAEKPKAAAKTRKKATPPSETLFDQPVEPTPEQ